MVFVCSYLSRGVAWVHHGSKKKGGFGSGLLNTKIWGGGGLLRQVFGEKLWFYFMAELHGFISWYLVIILRNRFNEIFRHLELIYAPCQVQTRGVFGNLSFH